MIRPDIISALKSFEWQDIIAKGNKLEDLNDRQWRFIKGLVVELVVEKHSGTDGLKYVGEDHKDYDWPFFNLTVELKSGLSGGMYGKRGQLKKSFNIKFNNSNGTNKRNKLAASEVADLLLVIKNDGAFVVDRDTVIKRSRKGGDGFDVILDRGDIVELTGKITINNSDTLNLQERITNAIREVI
jgi:hypothetical protein